MSGRRSHPRFPLTTPWEGAIRLLREVIVDSSGPDELVIICQAPGIVDEEMSLDLITGRHSVALKVKVVESRPVIVEGSLKHRLCVRVMPNADAKVASEPIEAAVMPSAGEAV